MRLNEHSSMPKSTRRRSTRPSEGQGVDLTPMIDIVFQLLIFFVVTAVFVQVEKELASRLPNRGGPPVDVPVPQVELRFYLDWIDDGQGARCVARTTDYQPESGGREAEFRFSSRAAASQPDESEGDLGSRLDYAAPDFDAIAAYIRYRRERVENLAGDLPVTIQHAPDVPVQMIVSMFDVCKRAGIRDFGVAY